MNGNSQYAGMLEMLSSVRKHAPTSMVVIAGMSLSLEVCHVLVSERSMLSSTGGVTYLPMISTKTKYFRCRRHSCLRTCKNRTLLQFYGRLLHPLHAQSHNVFFANYVCSIGSASFAYDSTSLLALDQKLTALGEQHVMFNFHPYMGPNQAGDTTKCPAGFEAHLQRLKATGRPTIATEFGQTCCATDGACESCPGVYNGTTMGYDEQIVVIARAQGTSWLPWSWRPAASGAGHSCMDLNGYTSGACLCPCARLHGNRNVCMCGRV